jgi:CubicO group peptidase (beta-lactamase class C family)
MIRRTPGYASLLILLSLAGCAPRSAPPTTENLSQSVRAYQQALIDGGVTGSSVAGVFRGTDTLVYSIVNSGLPGDTPITERTIFPIWSMSKPITITAMMILHQRGLYQMTDPVSKYLPYFADLTCRNEDGSSYRCRNELLVEHLLSHRSGYAYYPQGTGPNHLDPYENLDQYVRVVAAHPVEFEPGTDRVYGLNQAILGRLVEVLSGKEFYVFLKEEILDPLGMVDTKFELTAEDRARFQILFRKPAGGPIQDRYDPGTPEFTTAYDELPYTPGTKAQYGGEGLVSTFEDYRRFCEMLLGRGVFRGRRILEEQSLAMMTAATTPPGRMAGYNNGLAHGYSVFILQQPELDGTGSPKGIFGWSGYHNTHFWVDYENNLYGLFMTRTTPFSREIQKQFRAAVYRALP